MTTCPNCHERLNTDDWFEHFNHDGDSWELNCEHCGAPLLCRPIIEVHYDVGLLYSKGDNNE